MNLPEYSVNHRSVVLFLVFLLVVCGLYSYKNLGKLEDPEFTIKTATIITRYPGASPLEVEQQVTDEIEKAAQRLESLDDLRSVSKEGVSIVYVDVIQSYRKKTLPQEWDMLRRKINDVVPRLPTGAMAPEIYDDYGDVFGIFLALTGDGYSYAEMKDYAVLLQRELMMEKDVNRVELWGDQLESVYVEIDRSKLSKLGLHPGEIIEALNLQNSIIDSGRIDTGSERIRIDATGDFKSLDEIGELVIKGREEGELILLKDVADIKKKYLDPPRNMMRFNGKPAIGIAISTVSKGNVVVMGDAVKKRLDELMEQFPIGIEIGHVSYQADTVRSAINQFVVNLIEAVAIVIGILLITMGIRSGLLIGAALVLAIVGTFVVMLLLGIDLHRASLGALIISMGMLVDNAIVVTEGSLIRLQRMDDRITAATRPAMDTAWPLLGATLVAIAAFMPVYLSENNSGEYCETLFLVVAISLALSWIIAMVVTPVLCQMFLRVPKEKRGTDPYAGPIYRNYRFVLQKALHHRKLTILIMVVLLFLAGYGFKYVEKDFFPNSDRAQFMIDYWLPEGSRIQNVSEDLSEIEKYLLKKKEISAVTAVIGSGAPRFFLCYEPEIPNSSYGQLIINVSSRHDITGLLEEIQVYLAKNFPQADPRVRRFVLGPAVGFKIEARFSGPDPKVLRDLSFQAKKIMSADPQTRETRDNWRQRVKVYRPEFSQPRALRSYVARPDIARSFAMVSDGVPIGVYREKDELMPIFVRSPREERENIDAIENMPVRGKGASSLVLRQVLSGIETVFEDPIIYRYNRRRTITAQTQPKDGITANMIIARVKPKIDAIKLPPGYYLEWGGELENDAEAGEEINSKLPIAFVLMAIIVVALFNAFRQPLIILLILPLSIIGVTVGLLATNKPFGFMALLGVLSLFGMLIKNAVVLLDQIDVERREGTSPYLAVINSSISRMRPVLMASFTTVLGMIPLLPDPLYGAMAVAIMSGLSFATVLTLIVVPVLYTMFFRIDVNA